MTTDAEKFGHPGFAGPHQEAMRTRLDDDPAYRHAVKLHTDLIGVLQKLSNVLRDGSMVDALPLAKEVAETAQDLRVTIGEVKQL